MLRVAIVVLSVWSLAGVSIQGQSACSLPAEWQKAWKHPATEHRPLQIVHGIRLEGLQAEGVDQMVPGTAAKQVAIKGMQTYQDRGLGGIVCNVNFQDYMKSEEHWETLVEAVEACHWLGLTVWIYDEQGYPSGAAGGQVLQENPAYQAM